MAHFLESYHLQMSINIFLTIQDIVVDNNIVSNIPRGDDDLNS